MEKSSSDFFKFSIRIGVFLLMLTFTLAIPLFAGEKDVIASEAVSGDPSAAPVKRAPVFPSRVATSQQSDGTQSKATKPKVRIGKSVPGGDVGDAVVEQRPDIFADLGAAGGAWPWR